MTTTREQQRRYERSEKGRRVNKRKCAKYQKTEAFRSAHAKYRKKRKLRAGEVQRTRARGQIAYRIKKKEIVRPDHCSECSIECKPYAHHDDYEKPLDIRWLCQSCDRAAHKNQKEAPAKDAQSNSNRRYTTCVTARQYRRAGSPAAALKYYIARAAWM